MLCKGNSALLNNIYLPAFWIQIIAALGLWAWVSKVFIFKDGHNLQSRICWKNNDQAIPWDLEVYNLKNYILISFLSDISRHEGVVFWIIISHKIFTSMSFWQKKLTDVSIFQILLTLAKLHSGLSKLHGSHGKVDDVINGDFLPRVRTQVLQYVELELQWEEEEYNRSYITERETKWRVKGW